MTGERTENATLVMSEQSDAAPPCAESALPSATSTIVRLLAGLMLTTAVLCMASTSSSSIQMSQSSVEKHSALLLKETESSSLINEQHRNVRVCCWFSIIECVVLARRLLFCHDVCGCCVSWSLYHTLAESGDTKNQTFVTPCSHLTRFWLVVSWYRMTVPTKTHEKWNWRSVV
jgi:hypothetical protein